MKSFIRKNKELFYSIAFAAICSFMLFIFEPITLYANNINDFWFDFYTLIGPTSILFLASFTGLTIFFIILYLISNKTKSKSLFPLFFLIAIACFICAYIHSNFLSNFLPPLDGTSFDWSSKAANISSIAVCVITFITIVILVIKLGFSKTIKYAFNVALVIFAMLSVSLISTVATTNVFEEKKFTAVSTTRNINTASNQKNFMILLLDAVDSSHFNNIVSSNKHYQEVFKDFSYFPDTLSAYTFTRDSIPFIFSSYWNENEKPFNEYSTEAFNNSAFFDELSKQNYSKNFYDIDFIWQSRKALSFDNIESLAKNADFPIFAKQEIKYILFKTLPFPLKKFSSIDSLNFNAAQTTQDDNHFEWWDTNFYHDTLKQPITKIDDNYFQFIHLEGGHSPFNLSADVEEISEDAGTYEEKLEGSMKIIETYLNRLKENGAYDNAVIVVLADHGFWHNGTSRVNPILYIKGVGESHDKMLVSKKQISYADLSEAFIDLLSNKSSTKIFTNIPSSGRTRRYLDNLYKHENNMREYTTTDNAWVHESLTATGKEFNL